MIDVPERSAGTNGIGKRTRRPRGTTATGLMATLALAVTLYGCSGGSSGPSGTRPATPVSISPRRAALTPGQQIALTAQTNDSAGVKWTIEPDVGALDKLTSRDGQAIHFTAPNCAGVYSVKAAKATDPTQSS